MEQLSYNDLLTCVKSVADDCNVDIFDVIDAVDTTQKYVGFRKLFSKKYTAQCDVPEGTAAFDYGDMSVLLTGCRPGDIVTGFRGQSKDAMMKVITRYPNVVPPSSIELGKIKADGAWKSFIHLLGRIDFFRDLTSTEREIWLDVYSVDGDPYFEDIPGLEVEVLNPGNSFGDISEEQLEEITESGKVFSAKYVSGLFPAKGLSKGLGGKTTLLFRRGIWKITKPYDEVSSFDGVILDICAEEQHSKLVVFDTFALEYLKGKVVSSQKIAIRYPSKSTLLREDNVYSILLKSMKRVGNFSLGDILRVKKECFAFTAGTYKSAFQKFIRFRSVNVVFRDGKVYPSEFVSGVLFCFLLLHPGSFVPDISRFVSGLESAFKRLAIIGFEDSFFEDNTIPYELAVSSFLAQRLPGWKPTLRQVRMAIEFVIELVRSPKAFVYDTVRGGKLNKYVVSETNTKLQNISAILEEVRSFAGDLSMVRDIATNSRKGTLQTTENAYRQPEVSFVHCVDQHCIPETCYMYLPEEVEVERHHGGQPFSKLFGRLFGEVTGVNPRRLVPKKGKKLYKPEEFEAAPFTIATREAERLALLSKQISTRSEWFPSIRRRKTGKVYSLEYTLDVGWIAGLMGSVEVKGKPTALVSLNPYNPEVMNAIVSPSRNMTTAVLEHDREAVVMNVVTRRLLDSGVYLNQVTPPIPEMKGAMLQLDTSTFPEETVYIVKLASGERVRWDDYRFGSVDIDIVDDIPLTLENGLQYDDDGIVADADNKLREVLQETPREHIQRALFYISTKGSGFEFKRISRDGGGTLGTPSIFDVGAYHLIMKIKLLYPSALSRVEGYPLRFVAKVSPLLWRIKDITTEYLLGTTSTESVKWKGMKTTKVLRDYQSDALRRMKESYKRGQPSTFIDMSVGSGKTLIVLSYLRWLRDEGHLPKYIIYTLPASAMESIIKEITDFQMDYIVIVPLKGKKASSSKVRQDCIPQEGCITLIEHDYLRRCDLTEYMADAILVIDEVHKALNETQRTAVALAMSHLSQGFIALTGTPIVNTETWKLLWWLSQIAPFEVNEKNFFVAASCMISKKMILNAEVDRKDVEVQMTPGEMKKYQSLVPEGLGGTNSHPRTSDFQEAFEVCYDVVTKKMVDYTIKCLAVKRKDGLSNGAFVIARNKTHQDTLRKMLLERGVKSKDVFSISKDNSIYLTDEAVSNGDAHDYKVVITTTSHSAGYTLTRFNTCISSVYPSNNATREQLDGRINRIGQHSKVVKYRIFHTGILSYTLKRHNDAKNLSDVLRKLSDEIRV